MSKIHTVTLPDIGEGVVEGEVIEWLKEVGEDLKQDEAVVIVMTDKATVELPAPYPGKLTKHYYAAGEVAIKDKPLYDIETEEIVAKKKVREQKKIDKTPLPEKEVKKTAITPCANHKSLATPPTRKLAKDLGININEIAGTGNDGRVTVEDLKKSIPHTKAQHVEIPRFPDDEVKKFSGIPHLMAESMLLSKSNAPHFSYFEQVDATRLIQLRQRFKREGIKEGIPITYMPFIIRALSLSINKYPHVNSALNNDMSELIIHNQHNIGIAITTDLGLIVPVLRAVQDMSIEEIIRNYELLKNDALQRKLKSKDMKGSTITISNFGVLGGGGMWATPIINYPEVAILAIGRIQKRPVVRNGEIAVRDTLNLSWSFDHRVIDGDTAANFSHYFASLLQNPAALL